MGRFDFLGFQEVGSLSDVNSDSWCLKECTLAGKEYAFFCTSPPDAFRGSAVGIPVHRLCDVINVQPLSTGIMVTLKHAGAREFVASLHLPHTQRDDCMHVWHHQITTLHDMLHDYRLQDSLLLACDLNYELMHVQPDAQDARGSMLQHFLRSFGTTHTTPHAHTWSNSRGSHSRIDYLLFSTPYQETTDQGVATSSDSILRSDHRLVWVNLVSHKPSKKHRRCPHTNKCGTWDVDVTAALLACNQLAERLEQNHAPISPLDLEALATASSRRPKPCRYQDSAYIQQLIALRKGSDPQLSKELALQIVQQRSQDKRVWRTELLERAAAGDYKAISYFRKRQAVRTTHGLFALRMGGKDRAISALKHFYQVKFTDPNNPDPLLPQAILQATCVTPPSPAHPIDKDELEGALNTFKGGKSAGADGVTYELLQILAQTQASSHLLRTFNRYLSNELPPPETWFTSRLTLLPKIKEPCLPKHLRPIVLSVADYKLFTKILLIRLRRTLPPVGEGGQILGIPGAQVMDGITAARHAVHLASEWSMPLVVAKLDISQAFDTLSHTAVAKYLASVPATPESMLLLRLVTQAKVEISFADATWKQPLTQGILQGTPYGAELFARVLDFFLKPVLCKWQRCEYTWLSNTVGNMPLHCMEYADDILIFATSIPQLNRMLEDLSRTLQAIGLHLSWEKCKYLRSPQVPSGPVSAGEGPQLEEVETFLYLGVLLGFRLTCQAVLAARLVQATNAFFGYLSFLTQCSAPLCKRLHLMSTFVTSRWRWMSAAVRPTTAVHQSLKVTQTNFLVWICKFPRDSLQAVTDSWVCVRRAARMAAQATGHETWTHIQTQSFFLLGSCCQTPQPTSPTDLESPQHTRLIVATPECCTTA